MLALLMAPPTAIAASDPTDGNLSPRLAELARPALRSTPLAEVGSRLSLPDEGAGSLMREGDRLVVEVRFDRGAAASVDALRGTGTRILNVSPRVQLVTVAAPPSELRAIGALPGVAGVTEVLNPEVRADCGGSVVSEGDQLLNAASERAGLGFSGAGVTVGILSDSFDRDITAATRAATDVARGDLPGPGSPCGSSLVNVLDDNDFQGEDEGRAMLQIVHDLAPGASLDFASASAGIAAFAANIRALANAGSNVIADDIGYAEEPFFQDGPVAQAVNEVTASGIPYLSAAGNDNKVSVLGNDVGSWESPLFRDAGRCPDGVVKLSEEIEEEEEQAGIPNPVGLRPDHCEDFAPEPMVNDRGFGITVEEGATLTVDLQWGQPWYGVHDDLDAFLTDGPSSDVLTEGGQPVMSNEDNIGTSQRPFELLSWTNPGPEKLVELVINHFDGTGLPPIKFELQGSGGISRTQYEASAQGDTVGPLVYGQPGAAAAIAVGAVPYNNLTKAEEHSSPGPTRHYFGPVIGTAPAAPIIPQTIAKPDLAAIDGGKTTFFGRHELDGSWRFFGTSAATPHAAAIVALMRQANPTATPDQIRAALSATARPVGRFGAHAVGAGLTDAFAAVKAIELPPTITITRAPPARTRDRQPTFEFSANRPVTFRCQLQGGAGTCSSPFKVPAALKDGAYSFNVSGVDGAGKEGSSRVSFVVETKAPGTSIARHPRRLVFLNGSRFRARFRFKSDEPEATFECRVDRGKFRACPSNFSRSFRRGKHVIRVRAVDAAGNVDATPATFRFSVF